MGARMLAKGDSEIVGVITNYPNREEKLALADPFVSEMIAALENAILQANPTLLSVDAMHFTQTRIATIDSYSVFWIMLMYLFMFR